MTARQMINAIEFWVLRLFSPIPEYSKWRIGITDHIEDRIGTHSKDGKLVSGWRYWIAASEADARNVEHYFLHRKGDNHMWGGVGGKTGGKYVYVFRTTESR